MGPAYHLLYDAAASWFPGWPIAALGVATCAVGLALVRAARGDRRAAPAVRAAGTTLAILGAGWTLVVGAGLFADHARLRAALRDGSYSVVEGAVYDRPPGAQRDPDAPSWVVVERDEAAHWYRYGESPLVAGYRRRRPEGGGLREGMRVRIADVGGRIARLEVAR